MSNLDVSRENRKIIISLVAISLITIGIGAFFATDFSRFFLGVFAGTLFSILKLLLIEVTVKKSINMEPQKAINYVNLHYSFRYFLTGVFLFVCIKRPDISTLGAVIGLILLRPAIYIATFAFKNN